MNKNKLYIRNAVTGDCEILIDFQLSMAKETEGIALNPLVLGKGVKAVIEDPSKGQYYVAVYDDVVIGSLLTTYEWSDWRNGTVLWIQSVYVVPHFRRKGVYSNLYNYLKDIVLSDESLKGIRLYADKSNTPAHYAYTMLGMSPEHYVTFEWLK